LHSISKRAPFRLHLNELLHSAATFSSSTPTQEDAQAQLHEILAALCHSFPGTAELNLASLPLGNEGVVLVQKNLLNLAFLKLSGCKKLTSDAVIAVIKPTSTATATSAVSGSTSTLRCVDFQRCYQLTAEDLTTLLNACTRPGSKLSCAALSHLDLSSWTLKTFSKFSSSPSTLRMLALHNGIKLTAPGLRSIVSACPLLEVLCLGGSVLNLDQNSQVTPSITPTLTTATAATLIEDAVTNSGGSSPTAATAEQNNYSNSLQSTSPSSPSRSMFHTLSLLDRHEDDDGNLKTIHGEVIYPQQDPLVSQLLKNAGSCGLSPILLSSSHGIWLKNSAAELAAAAYRLPNLCILELTHCAPGLTLLVRKILESNSSPSTIASTVASTTTSASTATTAVDRVHVWDMCSAESVSAALHWRSTCTTRSTISTTTTTTTTTTTAEQTVATTLPRSDIEMIVTAMARCSSPGRITALHSAAEDGDVSLLSNLLSLGAEVDARDRGGASSLFCACEAGHAGAVATLLGAGASATLRNAAGEAPLYIAALRGHEQVVEVLLNYCDEKEITWQDQRLYGDGWTPLHAAAVSGRLGIAAILLAAAGPIDAAALVAASNRYGQTCVHVAARKGTPALVQLLIEAGGSASLAVADCDGRTAADVARRNGNAGAWKLLTGTMSSARSRTHQLQRATTPTVEKKARQQLTAAQHTGSNRWVGRRLGQRRVENV
jgi:ankyrin repeat protein